MLLRDMSMESGCKVRYLCEPLASAIFDPGMIQVEATASVNDNISDCVLWFGNTIV